MAQAPESEAAEPSQVVDGNGMAYTLTSCLGRGGQGSVWKTNFPDRVVKLLRRGSKPEALRRRLAYVRRLPIDGLPIASPLELLRPPDVGYTARLLRDMEPLRLLGEPPGSEQLAWYLRTGGLRRRLRLLAHAGEVLAELHGKGLAYVDVSPDNVFVSAHAPHEEAWLIDADNLRHDSSLEGAVFTPGYGAPELVLGKSGPTSLSDAWGFAVLVFQTLTLVHPFCGDLVNDGPPELEEQAHEARLPWVGHRSDTRNHASHGIPFEWVFGPRLLELARRTFETTTALTRPGVAAWIDALHAASDQTVVCTGCAGTFLASAGECPWCGERRPWVRMLRVERWEPAGAAKGATAGVVKGSAPVARLALGTQPLQLTRRLTRGQVGLEARQVEAEITPVERGLRVQMRGAEAWLTRQGASPLPQPLVLNEAPRIVPQRDPGGDWMLHLGPLDQPHRVVRLGGT